MEFEGNSGQIIVTIWVNYGDQQGVLTMRQPSLLISLAITLLASIIILMQILIQPAHSQSVEQLSFALIGDMPYNDTEAAQFKNLMQAIDADDSLAFVVHDGDIKSSSQSCSDQALTSLQQEFDQSVHPFILIFGDNEWTDCHRPKAGGYDPIDRLTKLRELFTSGDQSLGQRRLTLTRQSQNPTYQKFRENVRWVADRVMFVGLHIVGSNNNLGRTPEADAEYQARNLANLAWMKDSFTLAKRNSLVGVMMIIQANPLFEKPPEERTGFNDFIAALEAMVKDFGKPVVLVHGDTHYFQINKPLSTKSGHRLWNFTRVETFGSPDIHWLKATIDPSDPNVFQFQPMIVIKNTVS